jgi:hypothetical protein
VHAAAWIKISRKHRHFSVYDKLRAICDVGEESLPVSANLQETTTVSKSLKLNAT